MTDDAAGRGLYALCDEPGCERASRHKGFHCRTDRGGVTEWGDYADLEALVEEVIGGKYGR